jgi:hypothetical protein
MIRSLLASILFSVCQAFALDGQIQIHDPSTVVTCEGKFYTYGTKGYNVNLYHFAQNHGAPTSNFLFWALTIIDCPEELRDVRLAIGSNAASVWWVNGQHVLGIFGDRQTVIDDGVSKRLTLKKGTNVIRCAVFNAGGATDFCARLLGADEKPLKSFTVRLNAVGDKKP